MFPRCFRGLYPTLRLLKQVIFCKAVRRRPCRRFTPPHPSKMPISMVLGELTTGPLPSLNISVALQIALLILSSIRAPSSKQAESSFYSSTCTLKLRPEQNFSCFSTSLVCGIVKMMFLSSNKSFGTVVTWECLCNLTLVLRT